MVTDHCSGKAESLDSTPEVLGSSNLAAVTSACWPLDDAAQYPVVVRCANSLKQDPDVGDDK